MRCVGKCVEIKLELPGYSTTSDFVVIQLKEFDIVLGIQWLKILGSTMWNFDSLKMAFVKNGTTVELQGQLTPPNQLCDRKQISHCFEKRKQGLLMKL